MNSILSVIRRLSSLRRTEHTAVTCNAENLYFLLRSREIEQNALCASLRLVRRAKRRSTKVMIVPQIQRFKLLYPWPRSKAGSAAMLAVQWSSWIMVVITWRASSFPASSIQITNFQCSCKCGAEFCYVCGVNWKHCPCDQWNEERLVVRAREVVNRDAPRQLPRFKFNRRVDQMRNALRENHECAHRGWLPKIEGGNGQVFRCEMSAKRHTKLLCGVPTVMCIFVRTQRKRLRWVFIWGGLWLSVINLYHINFRLQFFEVLTYEISTGKKKSLENSHSRVDVVNITRSPQYFLRASSANAARFQLRTEPCSSEFPLLLMPLVRSVGHSDLRRFLRGFRDGWAML